MEVAAPVADERLAGDHLGVVAGYEGHQVGKVIGRQVERLGIRTRRTEEIGELLRVVDHGMRLTAAATASTTTSTFTTATDA